ncbi:MAG: hypothetical protein KIT84_22100 [Labilithrix sp.]|nr:hypothetical protein [Labilithrix sp.]
MYQRAVGLAALTFLAACHVFAPPPPARPAPPPSDANGNPLGVETAAARQARVGFALTEAPMSLTAGDGTGLRLASLRAKAVVDGPLAFTEMTLAFENPNDRTLEGTFRIVLPRGASLGRFAMKIDGAWQEGEVVELEQARRAYEDFLHRKQDPALMEKAAGNEFSARVFPIPARGIKEIVVAYVEEIRNEEYRLPLHGLPEVGEIAIEAKVLGASQQPAPLAVRNATPAEDYTAPVVAGGASVRSGELAIVRVKPQADSKPEKLDNAIVLVDTSASRVLGFGEELRALEAVLKKIGEEDGGVTVAAFDQVVTPIYAGKARAFGAKELGVLRDRDALGASDLERALAWAKDKAKSAGAHRVVLVTDGVITAGATDPKALLPKVSALKDAGIERIDAVAIGGIRDEVALGRIVRGALPRDGVVAEATETRKLGEATRSGVAVKVEGATWSWPAKLDGVQSGDTYSIYAEVPVDRPLRVSVGGAPAVAIETRKTERPLVQRAVAQAKVSSMLEREVTGKESLKKSIVSIATRERIMTPYTALLVLETEDDYARYGIDRRSLADVLAIEDGAVRRVRRTTVKLPLARPPMEEAFDLSSQALSDSSFESDALGDAAVAPSPSARPARPGGAEARKADESPRAGWRCSRWSVEAEAGARAGAGARRRALRRNAALLPSMAARAPRPRRGTPRARRGRRPPTRRSCDRRRSLRGCGSPPTRWTRTRTGRAASATRRTRVASRR